MKVKNVKTRQADDFSYKPQINKPNYEVLFNQDKSIHYDPTSRQFLERLENARREEQDKKKRVITDLSKISEKKWGKNIKHRSASADYSAFYDKNDKNTNTGNSMVNINMLMRNLHEELHNFNVENELIEKNEEY